MISVNKLISLVSSAVLLEVSDTDSSLFRVARVRVKSTGIILALQKG